LIALCALGSWQVFKDVDSNPLGLWIFARGSNRGVAGFDLSSSRILTNATRSLARAGLVGLTLGALWSHRIEAARRRISSHSRSRGDSHSSGEGRRTAGRLREAGLRNGLSVRPDPYFHTMWPRLNPCDQSTAWFPHCARATRARLRAVPSWQGSGGSQVRWRDLINRPNRQGQSRRFSQCYFQLYRMKLGLYPAWRFQRGSPDDEKDAEPEEKPLHEVRIIALYLGATEVTREQVRRFRGLDGAEPKCREGTAREG